MKILFLVIIVLLFIVESSVFIYAVKFNKNINDKYYEKYRHNNPISLALTKLLILGGIVYLAAFPGVLALRSGELGAYIAGFLYCYVALRFLWQAAISLK
jgi:heme/copper-type cytochrome/quinol oxidase subunit 2